MDTMANFIYSLFLMGMLMGGIACIVVGFDSQNAGGPVGGAILISAGMYFMSKEIRGAN